MAYYRIYFTGRGGHFQRCREIEACNDDEAIAFAVRIADGQPIEIWNRSRLVLRLAGEAQRAPK